MSDCLHCDIHEMLESHLQGEQADLGIAANAVPRKLPGSPHREWIVPI
jgi:hypothetical protein